tara:strand:+ start:639 stop:1250 length:612 start_codon:yes stop_codon:yes gene_type:complete
MAKHDDEMQRLIDIVNVDAVNRVSKPFKVEDAYKEDKKEELKEAIKIQTDTPEEAMAMMQILKNAGIEQKMPDMDRPDMPMKQDMENEDEHEIEQGADYRNSPDEKYDNDDPLDTYSTKPNKQTKFRRTGSAGDNPLTMAEELMAEYKDFKDTTEEVIGEDMVDDLKAKIAKLAKKPNLSKEEAAELDKLEDRMADISADLDE